MLEKTNKDILYTICIDQYSCQAHIPVVDTTLNYFMNKIPQRSMEALLYHIKCKY